MLGIDATSRDWSLVREAVGRRIEALSETCCSVASTPSDKQEAAVRIDELRTLLSAPEWTKRRTAERGTARSQEVY